MVESGTNYCIESMNSVDYAADELGAKSIMAVHLAGDYGDDAAAGARVAAEKRGLTFTDVKTATGQDNQAGAIDAIVSGNPDVVILTNGPTDAAVIIGQAGARGYKGRFIGTSPTWNPGLLKGPAASAIMSLYLQSAPIAAVRHGHPGPPGDAGSTRQRTATQRGTHRGMGVVLPTEGGVGEGGGE